MKRKEIVIARFDPSQSLKGRVVYIKAKVTYDNPEQGYFIASIPDIQEETENFRWRLDYGDTFVQI